MVTRDRRAGRNESIVRKPRIHGSRQESHVPGSRRTAPRGEARSLTVREREVLGWVARGKSAWEIGQILNITKRTVDEHVANAVRKLDAVNRVQAIAIAVRDGIIDV